MRQLKMTEVSKELMEVELERITFENIIHWRREELLRVLEGEKAVLVFPQSNQRSKLLRDGVLMTYYGRGGKRLELSKKAKRLLEKEI